MQERIINEFEIQDKFLKISKLFDKENIEELARITEFVKRESKLTGALCLSIFTLGVSLYERPTLGQLVGLLNIIVPDVKITREGFNQRLNDKLVIFFELMLSNIINISTEINLGLFDDIKRVLILDSSQVSLPEELSGIFKGSGGGASKSSLKIQFYYDLKSGQFYHEIQEGIVPDNKYHNSFVENLLEKDLLIKDLGYFNKKVFVDIDEKGAYYLSRWKSQVKLYKKDENGEISEFDLIKFVTKLEKITEVEVFIKNDDKLIKTRLVLDKVPDSVKEERLRKLNKANKKKGQNTTDETKILQGYNLYVSNVPPEILSKEDFRKLYGVRWQIELTFKNWKSNFDLDKLSGIKEARIKSILYSRFLMIFISTKMIFLIRTYLWIKNNEEVSEFKASKYLKQVFQNWFRIVIEKTKKKEKRIFDLLMNSIPFIEKNCMKIKQTKRVYPLDLLRTLGLA